MFERMIACVFTASCDKPLPSGCCLATVFAGVMLLASTDPAAAQINLTGSLTLVEEGPVAIAAGGVSPVNLATGATPFALDDFEANLISNLNNGTYGNNSSWIGDGDLGSEGPFAGIDFGGTPLSDVQSIAFGRSNVSSGDVCGVGVCMDRWDGLYALQYTQVADPSLNLGLVTTGDPTTGWVEIGTLEYVGSVGQGSLFRDPWVRHRYNFDPVDATGVRLIVPRTGGFTGGTAIDEIELYDVAGLVQPPLDPPPTIQINAASGFNVGWDGNDGAFFDSAAPSEGAIVPSNDALASQGAVAFTSSDLALGPHVASSINDGFYGNSNSWIGANGDPNPFIGVRFDAATDVRSVAWGRDNGNDVEGAQWMDRSLGVYTLQFTLVADPDASTVDTGDPSTGWQTIATFNYLSNSDDTLGGGFTSYFRHEFDLATASGAPLTATGLRLLVPSSGLSGGTAIDEFEVNTVPEPSAAALVLLFGVACLGYSSAHRRCRVEECE